MGRFINADAFASTGQGLLGNNMFSYCNNNPVNLSDPTGEFALSTIALVGIGVSAIIGGVVSAVGTVVSGGSIGEVIASTFVGAVTAGGIATVAAFGAVSTLSVTAVAGITGAIGAGGEMLSIAIEHGFHQNDPGYEFNWVTAGARVVHATGMGALGGAASYGLNKLYTATTEIVGMAISAETSVALGATDFSTRQIISATTSKTSSSNSPRKRPRQYVALPI